MLYVFGDYVLDTHLYELRHGGDPCPLGPQVFNVLAYLVALALVGLAGAVWAVASGRLWVPWIAW